jgi:hypothetical protein
MFERSNFRDFRNHYKNHLQNIYLTNKIYMHDYVTVLCTYKGIMDLKWYAHIQSKYINKSNSKKPVDIPDTADDFNNRRFQVSKDVYRTYEQLLIRVVASGGLISPRFRWASHFGGAPANPPYEQLLIGMVAGVVSVFVV